METRFQPIIIEYATNFEQKSNYIEVSNQIFLIIYHEWETNGKKGYELDDFICRFYCQCAGTEKYFCKFVRYIYEIFWNIYKGYNKYKTIILSDQDQRYMRSYLVLAHIFKETVAISFDFGD
jgi:hypothetical protein